MWIPRGTSPGFVLATYYWIASFLSTCSLPGTRTSDAAVRYGCIILSLDLCGMPSDADMRIDGMKEYLLARNVALEWLQSLVPTEQLLQKPINIQVRVCRMHCVSKLSVRIMTSWICE